jgi:hypothetical protein
MYIKKRYEVKIELVNEMLGTNPSNPSVHDQFIIERQRKLIADKSNINKQINKYLKAKDIDKEKKDSEIEGIFARIEEVIGRKLTDEEKENHLNGTLDLFKDLKESFESLNNQGTTVFFRNEAGNIAIGSHMILGFLKASGETYSRTQGAKKGQVLKTASYTQSMINQYVTVGPNLIESSKDINRDPQGNPLFNQRSLRAMTAQGPRVSLAKSEVLPAGTQFTFYITLLGGVDGKKEFFPISMENILTLMRYGADKGLGQWRNAGKGVFNILGVERVPLEEVAEISIVEHDYDLTQGDEPILDLGSGELVEQARQNN